MNEGERDPIDSEPAAPSGGDGRDGLEPLGSTGYEPAPPRGPRGIGPIVMLVPALLFLLAVLMLRDHAPDPGPRPRPPVAGESGDVPGWSGALEVPVAGTRLTARLTRLHAQPERQAFDAGSLRERLGLDAGEPWLLTLRFLEGGEAGESALGLRVAEVQVADAGGLALTALTASTGAIESTDVADPLRTLLAPPAGVVRPGQTVNVFLWGREPAEGVRLVGLSAPGAETEDALLVELAPKALGRSDDSLAALDLDARAPEEDEER